MSLVDIPTELHETILYLLPIESVLNMCQVNLYFAAVCRDQVFWKNRLQLDHPQQSVNKPANMTWRDKYRDVMTNMVELPLYYKDNQIGTVWVRNTNTYTEVENMIMLIFNAKFPQVPFFIRVISNAPQQDPYFPILTNSDNTFNQRMLPYTESLWDTAEGFEIVEGTLEQHYIRPRSADEPNEVNYWITLPGQNPIHKNYSLDQ